MTTHYRTLGIVLNQKDLKEANQIFNLFTEGFGKIKIQARSIRKITSKLRAGIGSFYLSEVEFIQGKGSKILTDAIALDKFKVARNDFNRLEAIQKVSTLTDILIKGQEKDDRVWNLLLESFKKIDDPRNSSCLAYHYYFWNLFRVLGYCTNSRECLKCKKRLFPENNTFCFKEGGIVCSECSDGKEQVISSNAIKAIRIILEEDWGILKKVFIPDKYFKELDYLSEECISNYKNL